MNSRNELRKIVKAKSNTTESGGEGLRIGSSMVPGARPSPESAILKDMSVNEELSEGVEHAKEPFDRQVAVSMAIIAAALAIVSVLGHIYGNEELLAQQRASHQW